MQVIPLRLSSFEFCDSFSQKLRIEETLQMSVAAREESIVDQPSQDSEDGSDREFAFAPDGDGEFSFAPNGEDSSQISAEEIFSDGLIRPVFPLFNRDILFSGDGDEARVSGASPSSPLRPPMKKLFSAERPPATEEEEDSPAAAASATEITGPCCEWSSSSRKEVVETSPGVCKKSNSTGHSKLWRFRDLVNRSSSDGKDAFVFLNNASPAAETEGGKKTESSPALSSERRKTGEGRGRGGTAAVVGERKVRARGPKGETASLAYMREREAAKEKQKRRSYLPYRQDLLGFFTNVNGLSRNVHPF